MEINKNNSDDFVGNRFYKLKHMQINVAFCIHVAITITIEINDPLN